MWASARRSCSLLWVGVEITVGVGGAVGRRSSPWAGPRLQHAGLRKLFSWQRLLPASAASHLVRAAAWKGRNEVFSQ